MTRTILILTLLISACNNTTTTTNVRLETFVKKFKQTDLPLTIKACKILEKEDELPKLTQDEDSPFVADGSISLAYYTFKPNGNYVATVSLGLADCLLPILTTYGKDGKQIDQKVIGIGGCGSGPGFSCEEFMTIKSDYSIYTSDTISQEHLDSTENIIVGSKPDKYVVYKKGRLLNTGKIELTDEIKKTLENE